MDFFEIKALAGTIVGGMLIVGAAFGVGPVSNDHWEPSNVIQLFSNDATSSNKTAGTPDNGTVQNLSDRAANSHPPETGGTGGDAADEADDEQPAPSGGQRVVATPQPTPTPGPLSVAGSTDHNDDDDRGDPGADDPDDQDGDG